MSPRLIVVTGPIREPLHRTAGHLIGKSVVSLAVVLCALSITLFVAPDVPLRWVLVVAATVCAAICVVSIALGVAIKLALRRVHEARRREAPDRSPAVSHLRTQRPIVIDGSVDDVEEPLTVTAVSSPQSSRSRMR